MEPFASGYSAGHTFTLSFGQRRSRKFRRHASSRLPTMTPPGGRTPQRGSKPTSIQIGMSSWPGTTSTWCSSSRKTTAMRNRQLPRPAPARTYSAKSRWRRISRTPTGWWRKRGRPGLTLTVAFVSRFGKEADQAKQFVDSGILGTVLTARAFVGLAGIEEIGCPPGNGAMDGRPARGRGRCLD